MSEIDNDPQSLINLYNLKADPTESVSVLDDSSYANIVATIKERAEYWQDLVLDPEEATSVGKKNSWKKCGGVCPWVSGNESFTPIDDSQIYNYKDAPNLIFVLVDDWGWNDVGFRSNYLSWTTPTIDRLASEGVKLENYFTYYLCTPSRGAFLTGRYHIRLGQWEARVESEMPITEATIAQELRSAGYRTYMVGKWHVGFSTPYHIPTSRGFDQFYGYLNGHVDYWTKEFSGFLDLQSNDKVVTDSEETSSSLHNGYLLQTKAEAFIDEHADNYSDQPMFFYYALQLIHGYWSAPDTFLQRCTYPPVTADRSEYVAEVEYNYCALNVMLDEVVTNLTCKLESRNMLSNTVMILVSDNGGESTVPGNNFPMRGAKGAISRGGISGTAMIHSQYVPDAMRGQSYHGQVHVTDWLPTLMGLATNGEWESSLSGADIDGSDIWSAVMSNSASPHTEIVHYADGMGNFSIQQNMIKMDSGFVQSSASVLPFVFSEDLTPDAAVYSCIDPSLMYPKMIGNLPVGAIFSTLEFSIGSFNVDNTSIALFTVLGVLFTALCFVVRCMRNAMKTPAEHAMDTVSSAVGERSSLLGGKKKGSSLTTTIAKQAAKQSLRSMMA